MLKKSTLGFLKKLKKNNNREWFNENKHLYLDAKADFEIFVYELIREVSLFDDSIALLEPKDCIFRIYKDVRFSKDKNPYKTNLGAVIQQGGKKSPLAGFYFHVQPGEMFIASGVWMPDAERLLKIRRAIAGNYKEFVSIVKSKEFVRNFKDIEGDKLKTAPKGFDKEHPGAEYLKLKSFVAYRSIDEDEVFKKDIIKKAAKMFKSLQPFNEFLNRAITSRS
jgi:uncharacterized protein (TIGR02453 family)